MLNQAVVELGKHLFDRLVDAGLAPPGPQDIPNILAHLGMGQNSSMPPQQPTQLPVQPMVQGGGNGVLGTPSLNPMGQINPQLGGMLQNQPLGAQRGIFGTQGFHTQLSIDPSGQLQQMILKRSKGAA